MYMYNIYIYIYKYIERERVGALQRGRTRRFRDKIDIEPMPVYQRKQENIA